MSYPAITSANVLIVQPFLFTLSGSEIISLELAEALTSQGSHVAIATWGWSAELAEEVTKIPGLELFDLESNEFKQYCKTTKIDLVWVHQGLVPKELLPQPPADMRFVFAHLSAFNSFERPFAPLIETVLADLVYFVSPETEEIFKAQGLLAKIPASKKHIFSNPTPASFGKVPSSTYRGPLRSILVVSNHLPPELIEVIVILRKRGLEVTVVGSPNENIDSTPQRVTADLISQHDCVVSIGKTVQYTLRSGKPLYCYDYFGGPGWLSDENFEKALHYNFSGRGFARKNALEIADEIVNGYTDAKEFAVSIMETANRLFDYRNVLDSLEEVLTSESAERPPIPSDLAAGFINAHETVRDFGISHHNLSRSNAEYRRRLSEAALQQEHLELKVAEAHAHIIARRPAVRIRRITRRILAKTRTLLSRETPKD